MSDASIRQYRMLARYNRLANLRLYDACAALPDAERKKTRPAFFKSIHGTLNHILVGDRIWMTRFTGGTVPSTSLDAILYEGFGDLRQARREADERIEAFAGSLSPAFLEGPIQYENNEGRMFDDAISMLLTHFFTHQTHHRGQVHDLLTQTCAPPPVLDLHRVLKPDPD
ncbi:MAG: DinB family protein [Alphaproteobacteria bacterium]|nr:DinB family protein [Alphaproteobacteria bacterium]